MLVPVLVGGPANLWIEFVAVDASLSPSLVTLKAIATSATLALVTAACFWIALPMVLTLKRFGFLGWFVMPAFGFSMTVLSFHLGAPFLTNRFPAPDDPVFIATVALIVTLAIPNWLLFWFILRVRHPQTVAARTKPPDPTIFT